MNQCHAQWAQDGKFDTHENFGGKRNKYCFNNLNRSETQDSNLTSFKKNKRRGVIFLSV